MTLVRPVAVLLLGVAAAWCTAAGAQQIFRIVGPDGRVTFSDRPPTDANAKATAATVVPLAGAEGNAGLPFELRTVANKYPVTLYTAANCSPCGTARNFLGGRGFPYTEKTITTNDDIEALKRMTGATTLPFLTIGSQQIKGFSEVEWAQFLDAAGYPKTSQLPAAYRNPAASPLVAVQGPRPAASAATAQTQTPANPATSSAPADGPNPENPAGIRF